MFQNILNSKFKWTITIGRGKQPIIQRKSLFTCKNEIKPRRAQTSMHCLWCDVLMCFCYFVCIVHNVRGVYSFRFVLLWVLQTDTFSHVISSSLFFVREITFNLVQLIFDYVTCSKQQPRCNDYSCMGHWNRANQIITFYVIQRMAWPSTGARQQRQQRCHWSSVHDITFHFCWIVPVWEAMLRVKFMKSMTTWWTFWTIWKIVNVSTSELYNRWILALVKGNLILTDANFHIFFMSIASFLCHLESFLATFSCSTNSQSIYLIYHTLPSTKTLQSIRMWRRNCERTS